MRKKVLASLLALTLAAGMLAGCGSKKEEGSEAKTEGSVEITQESAGETGEYEPVTITLNPKEGWGDYDLYLMANNERFAYQDNAQYKSTESGAEQKLTIEKPRQGTLYVSVFCNTTVDTVETAWGTQYTGRLDVLNGVPYNITAVVE